MGEHVAKDLPGELKRLRRHELQRGLTQGEVGRAVGGERPLSGTTISNWENPNSPKTPSPDHLERYARLFCTPRTIEGDAVRLLDDTELTVSERGYFQILLRRLLDLSVAPEATDEAPPPDLWVFPPGEKVRIICGELDGNHRPRFADRDDDNFVKLAAFTDVDALVTLYGHLKVRNPQCDITYHTPSELRSEDLGDAHLVILGGVGWNDVTWDFMHHIPFPVAQIRKGNNGPWVFVDDTKEKRGDTYGPQPSLKGHRQRDSKEESQRDSNGNHVIAEYGLFVRHVNPGNRTLTVTICSGNYTPSVLEMARFLSTSPAASRNTRAVLERVDNHPYFWMLALVRRARGEPLPLDFTVEDTIERIEAIKAAPEPAAGAARGAAQAGRRG